MIKNYDGRKTVIDHNTEETIQKTIEIGAWTSKYRTEHGYQTGDFLYRL